MARERIRKVLASGKTGCRARLCGWVRTRRESKGGFSFIELNDGSCLSNIQVIADSSLPNYNSDIAGLHPGASIVAEGELVQSPGSGQAIELRASSIIVTGFCDPLEYPLGKQRVSFELMREIAHLRPRTNSIGAVARIRNFLAFAIHRFFQERDFLYVHTPIITASDCEGAGEMFRVTTLPPGSNSGFAEDFFGKRAALTVSGQLEGEAYACAMRDIYTFGPTFRAENSNTRRHLAEFWMVEPEMAFANLDDDADIAEEFLRFLFREVLENCIEDLSFLDKRVQSGLIEEITASSSANFARITYTQAVEILKSSGKDFEFAPEWGADLQSEHEKFLTEVHFKSPVVIRDYPKTIKPFYMRVNDDSSTVAAMDVLLPGVGEIIGGSQREERLDILISRMNEQNLNPDDYWWYCELRKFGSVPHAGFGLGFERIVQACTGMQNIRDVIPFPRTPGSVDF